MAKLNFNAAQEEGMDDYSVVPADNYNVQIVKSEVADTKAKAEGRSKLGKLLKLQFKIIDGKFKGRIVFGQYNIENENQQALQISKKQMKTLCDAIGKPNGVDDSNEMHNIPLQIKIGIKPAQGVYAEQNDIKFYAPYEGPKVEGAASTENPGNPAKEETTETGGTATEDNVKSADSGGAPWNKG